MLCRLLAVSALVLPVPASAADWYTGAKAQVPGDDWIVAVDVSADVTSQGSYFGDVLVTAAPTGTLAESGPRLRADALGGVYSYYASDRGTTVHGNQESGAVLAGYEWVSPATVFSAYLGVDVRDNRLSIIDPSNPVIGTSVGAKVQGELYTKPSLGTMVAAQASFATNKDAYFARLRTGTLIGPDLYVGPEVVALGDQFFNQERVGVHLTGLRAGPLKFALSGGYLTDRVRGNGGYVTVDARVGF